MAGDERRGASTGHHAIERRPDIRPSDGNEGGRRARRLRAKVISWASFKRLRIDFDAPYQRRIGRKGVLRGRGEGQREGFARGVRGRRHFRARIEPFQALAMTFPADRSAARSVEVACAGAARRAASSKASGTMPFPGADSIFSRRCGAIIGRSSLPGSPKSGWMLAASNIVTPVKTGVEPTAADIGVTSNAVGEDSGWRSGPPLSRG